MAELKLITEKLQANLKEARAKIVTLRKKIRVLSRNPGTIDSFFGKNAASSKASSAARRRNKARPIIKLVGPVISGGGPAMTVADVDAQARLKSSAGTAVASSFTNPEASTTAASCPAVLLATTPSTPLSTAERKVYLSCICDIFALK